jgi:aspartate/glutamate racemase
MKPIGIVGCSAEGAGLCYRTICLEAEPLMDRHAHLYFNQVIEGLKNQGCDAVVLGCTELPLLVAGAETPLPALDSTRILARPLCRKPCVNRT